MKRSWWVALTALSAGYLGSAALVVPGLDEGELLGGVVHPTFGKTELLELVVLTAVFALAAGRVFGRWRWLRSVVFATGLAFISAGLFLGEARWQEHGFLVEQVIAAKLGPPWQLFAGAATLVGFGALVCGLTSTITPVPSLRQRRVQRGPNSR